MAGDKEKEKMSTKLDEFHDALKIDNRCPQWFREEVVGLCSQAGKCQWWNVIGRINKLEHESQVEFDKILKDQKDLLRK